MSGLDRFYPIFDSADWLSRLIPLGIKLVQLRVKDRPEDEVRAEITASKRICARHGCQLIVNDHWRLAIDLGCDFVHLGQEDLDGADLDAIRAERTQARLEHARPRRARPGIVAAIRTTLRWVRSMRRSSRR